MMELNEVLEAYIVCALWSSTDNSREDGGDPLDDHYDENSLHPSTLKEMQSDCEDFLKYSKRLITKLPKEFSAEQVGHDFWLTRNGHGAGFWDRGLDTLGDELSDAAKTFGACDLYVGDDEKIYI